MFLIHNHIRHPSSYHNHPNKLLLSTIVHQILWTKHNITILKVKAHIKILDNEIADQLANKGSTTTNPHTHIVHTILYWLNGIPTSKHHEEICNLQTHTNKYHREQEVRKVQIRIC